MSAGIALDRRAADDRVLAVVVANPRLPVAVVVGAPHDERRVAATRLHALGALGRAATPDAYARVVLPPAPDRPDPAVAGQDAAAVRHPRAPVPPRALARLC